MSTQSSAAPTAGCRTRKGWHIGLTVAVVSTALAAWFARGADVVAEAAPMTENAQQPIAAPELEGGTAWLNTAGPIRLADLKGRIVLIDFWTLCCINCMHTLPDLAKLEAKYPGVLVVIGVHTPKFDNEKNTESIRKAILRYEISHPVVNDANMAIWKRYRVSSWPTLFVIDPEGNIYDFGSGEGHYEVLDKEIGDLVKKYKANKMLVETPLKFELARNSESGDSPLFFPGKVVADEPGNRLFIADSTHHRIVITDLAGKKIAIAGSGEQGFKDGAFDEAKFSDPQGMTLVSKDKDEILYVADRKNHAIRALDLKNQTVKTVAGTGKQGRDVGARAVGGPALKVGLNSPWDLMYHNGKIYIAMAGHHQIWTYTPSTYRVDPFAGSGQEEIIDGPPKMAAFAQPSGLATDGTRLWVADSETSSIRVMALSGKSDVKSVVGQGLFEFGDIEGTGNEVRLQHALGVAYRSGMLYVADTYNSKIKLIDPAKRTCKTFVGERGGWLSAPTFNEPGGLSFAGDKLYVADTNGHRIRVVDMKTQEVTTLPLTGVQAPKMSASTN
jgi:DNA-binding beta-propeller fold protein YncE